MFADLHAHYPMRVVAGVDPGSASRQMRAPEQPTWRDRIQARVLRCANRIGNFPSWDGTYRIDPKKLADGNVRLALSVLFRPFEEMDLSKRYAAPPEPEYFEKLLGDLEAVEAEVASRGLGVIRIVRDLEHMREAFDAGVPALVHAVEGGFHLGNTETEIEDNCATLANRGVGYVTVAHLFFRQVATNANAVPFIPDRLYSVLFPQWRCDRLTPRGEALVGSLIDNKILVDLSHMDPPAIAETLAYMDMIDEAGTVPVISTHAGFRFGKQRYMHDSDTLKKIRDRNGVVGLILAQHQINDGLRSKAEGHTETLDESLPLLFRHIDAIATATESHDHIAIGSDLDGFIKPTIGGIKDISDLASLEDPLRREYGDEIAEKIMWKNALRVLEAVFPERRPVQA